MAGFHGLFLASILYFNKRFRSKSNQFLAMALFAISIIVCYDFFYYSVEEEELPLVIQYLPIYIRTAIPIGLYFFIRYLIEPDSQFERMGTSVVPPHCTGSYFGTPLHSDKPVFT